MAQSIICRSMDNLVQNEPLNISQSTLLRALLCKEMTFFCFPMGKGLGEFSDISFTVLNMNWGAITT